MNRANYLLEEQLNQVLKRNLNELAQEGWAVKSSNITALPQANAEKTKISAYALLEREKIPAPFRAHAKNNV